MKNPFTGFRLLMQIHSSFACVCDRMQNNRYRRFTQVHCREEVLCAIVLPVAQALVRECLHECCQRGRRYADRDNQRGRSVIAPGGSLAKGAWASENAASHVILD